MSRNYVVTDIEVWTHVDNDSVLVSNAEELTELLSAAARHEFTLLCFKPDNADINFSAHQEALEAALENKFTNIEFANELTTTGRVIFARLRDEKLPSMIQATEEFTFGTFIDNVSDLEEVMQAPPRTPSPSDGHRSGTAEGVASSRAETPTTTLVRGILGAVGLDTPGTRADMRDGLKAADAILSGEFGGASDGGDHDAPSSGDDRSRDNSPVRARRSLLFTDDDAVKDDAAAGADAKASQSLGAK